MENLSNTLPSIGTITIPINLSPEELITWSKTEFERAGIPFTHFNEDLLHLVRQDLEPVCGKTLKVLIHNFGHDWKTLEGREFQEQRGFDGNAAAYLVWVTKTKPMGWSVSIANNDARLSRSSGDILYAPTFIRGNAYREFGLCHAWGGWAVRKSLVSFSRNT